jgi:hypothetical protein
MGFGNFCERKLNLNRRATQKQRARQQSQVQVFNHGGMDTPEWFVGQMFFCSFSRTAKNGH